MSVTRDSPSYSPCSRDVPVKVSGKFRFHAKPAERRFAKRLSLLDIHILTETRCSVSRVTNMYCFSWEEQSPLYESSAAHAMALSHILIELIGRHDAGHRAAGSAAIALWKFGDLTAHRHHLLLQRHLLLPSSIPFIETHVARVLATEHFRTFQG